MYGFDVFSSFGNICKELSLFISCAERFSFFSTNVSEYKMPYSVYIDTGNNKRIKSITHNIIFM